MQDGSTLQPRLYQNIVAQGDSRNHFGDAYITYAGQRTRRERLLKSLTFDGLHHPRELEAFEGTYEWVFEDEATSFPNWACHDDSTFWVTGKAGSGKSTLMRFISEHDRTRALLQQWAGDNQLIVANFFFWSAGNIMQKSRQGLMQGLLHQILYQSADIDVERVAERRKTDDDSAWKQPWTRRELSQALRSIVLQLQTHQRFCLFVDGLDEYEVSNPDEGNYDDLVEYLNTLAASPFVKICVASRPWNVFKDAYIRLGRFQIRMEELTKDDMALLIKCRLSEDPRFVSMLAKDADAADLITLLGDSAQGVFLWVALAVKDVKRGLAEQDDLQTLRRRVRLLPKELDAFLERMFQSIEPVYKKLAARFLLLTLEGFFPSGHELLEYSFFEEVVNEPQRAEISPMMPLSSGQVRERLKSAELSITKWCKDLVEVTGADSVERSTWRFGYDFRAAKVQFPHRVVYDFMWAKERPGTLCEMAGVFRSALIDKFNMMLLVLKGSPDTESMKATAEHILEWFEEGHECQGVAYVQQFRDFDRVCSGYSPLALCAHWSSTLRHREDPIVPATPAGWSAISLAMCRRLNSVALALLEANDHCAYNGHQLLYALALALIGTSPYSRIGDYPDCAMVDRLLQGGHTWHMNARVLWWSSRRYSVWELFLIKLGPGQRNGTQESLPAVRSIMSRLLEHGADPNAHIYRSGLTADVASMLQTWMGPDDSLPATQVFSELHQWWLDYCKPEDRPLTTRYSELKCVLETASKVKKNGLRKTRIAGQKKERSRSRLRAVLSLRNG